MRKVMAGLCLSVAAQCAIAQETVSVDAGLVADVQDLGGGLVSVQFNTGFPNAVNDGQCPRAGRDFNARAGAVSSDNGLLMFLQEKQQAGEPARLAISGCEGDLFRIVAIVQSN